MGGQMQFSELVDPKVWDKIVGFLDMVGIEIGEGELKCSPVVYKRRAVTSTYLFWSNTVREPTPFGQSGWQWYSLDGKVQVASVHFQVEGGLLYVSSLSRNRNGVFFDEFWAGVVFIPGDTFELQAFIS